MAPTRWSIWPASPLPEPAGPRLERPRSRRAACCRRAASWRPSTRRRCGRPCSSAARPSAFMGRAATKSSRRLKGPLTIFSGGCPLNGSTRHRRPSRVAHAWSWCGRASCSSAMAARSRPCCRPSGLAWGAQSRLAVSTWSWIHRADWIALTCFLLARSNTQGPVNATAPVPVTNDEFSRTLARVLKRPCLFRAPASILRLAMGEMADALLLTGQRVVPARAQEMGFRFEYETLEPALRAIFR